MTVQFSEELALNFYDKINPEFHEIKHDIHFYHGLKEVGCRTTKEAQKSGYLLLLPHHKNPKRKGIFIHENDWSKLEQLVDTIAMMRQEKEEEEKPLEKEEDHRQKKFDSILEEFQETFSDDDRIFLEYCFQIYPLEGLTFAHLLKGLEIHRKSKAILESTETHLVKIDCTCSWCLDKQKNLKISIKQQRQEYLQEMRWQLENSFDYQLVADDYLGDLVLYAKRTKIEEFYREAINDVVSIDWEESDDLTEKLKRYFFKKLHKYKRYCENERERQEGNQRSQDYFVNEFLPRWKEKEEALYQLCAEHNTDDGGLIDFYWQQITQFIHDHVGYSLKKTKSTLDKWMQKVEEDILHRLVKEQQDQKLQEIYSNHTDFANYFPLARELKREIWFFAGPTNSGKTHAALNEVAKGTSGVYLAPLRLMALEGQEQFQNRGLLASYLTGEERDIVEGSEFIASTIEMLDYNRKIDTAIIDEIQMIGDEQRGWAWTNALVGVPAQKVILTGSVNALPIVQKIADYLGESLNVRTFKRFNKLETHKYLSFLDQDSLQPGTAIVCFSRRDVLGLKQTIERETNYAVSVIYGGLSPDVRRVEAMRFRQKETDILVATDAISMGLNLPIRTLLFWKTEKRYNNMTHVLTDNDIKQIAGRAGRYGFETCGYVGAFSWRDLERIQDALRADLPQIEGPCTVRPLPFHIKIIADILSTEDLEDILDFFEKKIWFSKELFEPLVTSEMLSLAHLLKRVLKRASLEEKYTFICAPVDIKADIVIESHQIFAHQFSSGLEASLEPSLIEGKIKGIARTFNDLRTAEDRCKVVTLYSWLAYRYPESFSQLEKSNAYKEILNDYIARSLSHGGIAQRCIDCGRILPFGHRHVRCDDCFFRRSRRQSSYRK